jgi:hypothetical protein
MKKRTTAPSVSGKADSATAELPVEQRGYSVLTRYDWVAAPIVALLAAIWLFFHIYSAINWDDLLYMSLATHTEGQAGVLNRYGHIYILKLFYALTGDAILGTRIYWCFFFAALSTLIYWSARLLAGNRGAIISILAVLLVFMEPIFGREAGSPLADFTVMLLVTFAVFLYLAFLSRRDKYTHWILVLLGLIFFWAVKSKETGICFAVLFLGLGRDNQNRLYINRLIKDLGWVLCGILAGSFLLMCLDAAFVGDFWFSVRPANIRQLFGGNLGEPFFEPQVWTAESWFAFFTTRPVFVLFILYVITGFTSHAKGLSTREKLIWIVPLFLMLFLTFSRRGWYVVPRYFVPAMPVMAIFAAQFFNFETAGVLRFDSGGQAVSRKFLAVALVFAAFIIILFLLVPRIDSIVEYYRLDTSKVPAFPNLRYDRLTDSQLLYMLVIMPLAMSGLLVAAVLTKKKVLPSLFFVSLCLFALMLPPFRDGYQFMDAACKKSKWRFEPCRAFKDDLKFDSNTKIVVSKNVFGRTWLMGRDARAHCHIFNIFFNQKLRYDQFTDGTDADILKGEYDYALLLADDFVNLRGKPEFQKMQGKFALKTADVVHPSGGMVPLVMLIKIGGPSGNVR